MKSILYTLNTLMFGCTLLYAEALIPLTGMQPDQYLNPADSVPKDNQNPQKREHLLRFRTERTTLHSALLLFASSHGLRFKAETPISGTVSADFSLPLNDAMETLLKGTTYRWKVENNTLVVSAKELTPTSNPSSLITVLDSSVDTRILRINYPRLKRVGRGASNAMVSQAGEVSLSMDDELSFWTELEEQLKNILGGEGTVVVHQTSGVILLRDVPDRLDMAQRFILKLVPEILRQVEITARIYEITLKDDNSLGVDWTRVAQSFDGGGLNLTGELASSVILDGPNFKAPTIAMNIARAGGRIDLVINALREQGDVRAVSQPRVVTLNNQMAMIKVGTDLPFFSSTVSIDASTGQREVTEAVQVVTVGVILSLTPQISDDGWIIMGVDPIITDLLGTATSSFGSSAPIVDIKQSSSIVRLRDGETARISGLLHTKESEVVRKVPLLGEIPVLGSLFRWSYRNRERKELIIFLTPNILE
jgi:MSHA biogenesis protein MshL